MAIDFPNSPALNAYFESNGKAWTYNGTSWDIVQTPANLAIANASITGAKLASGASVTNIGYTPANVASPTFTGTVSGITKSMVGLGSVDNTADTAKPVSTAQQTALNLKAPLAAPTFTGTVTLPSTTSVGDVTGTQISYLAGVTSMVQTQLNAKAPVESPTFVGNMTHDFTHGINHKLRLTAGNNGSGTGEASLIMWVSEPAATWTGCGIARNRTNSSGSFPRVNTGLSGQMMRFGESGEVVFYMMNAAGTVENTITFDTGGQAYKPGGGSWAAPSDIRLKDNVRDYEKGSAELMQVRVREWEHNGKGSLQAGSKGLGVVADEIELVLPGTVHTYEGKLNPEDEETTQIKAVNPTEITWLLVKTVQEQQAVIEQLTARLEALEA